MIQMTCASHTCWHGVACVGLKRFARRALLLIDPMGLWSDDLYTVVKIYQPSYEALLAMLRLHTRPYLYFLLVWFWGGCYRCLPSC